MATLRKLITVPLASNEDHFEGAAAGVSSRDPVHPFKGILEKVWVSVIGMALA